MERAPAIEIYADIWCPFAHVGLRWLRDRRDALGRDDVVLLVRAWPLELVNGHPQDVERTCHHVAALRAQVAPELFTAFDPDHFPTSTLGALAVAAAAYRHDPRCGEHVSLELRDLLFEHGVDVSDPRVLEGVAQHHGLTPGEEDERAVLEDWRRGVARHVRGSPHVFVGDRDAFCPSLDLATSEAGAVEIRERLDRLTDLIAAVPAPG